MNHLRILPIVGLLFLVVGTSVTGQDVSLQYKKAREAVFIVENYTEDAELQKSGTGFTINSNGLLLTNWHVVKDNYAILVWNVTETDTFLLPVESIIAHDTIMDYALIQLKKDQGPYKYLSVEKNRIEAGMPCYVIGHPSFQYYSITSGIISQKRYEDYWIQTDAAVNPGNSGGPLLNDKFEAIGMITFGSELENLNLALNIGKIPGMEYYVQNNNLERSSSSPKRARIAVSPARTSPASQTQTQALQRGVRAYIDALIYGNCDLLFGSAADVLDNYDGHKNISRSKLTDVCASKLAEGQVILENDIEWDTGTFLVIDGVAQAKVDVLTIVKNKSGEEMITHFVVHVKVDGKGRVTSAYSEVINQF